MSTTVTYFGAVTVYPNAESLAECGECGEYVLNRDIYTHPNNYEQLVCLSCWFTIAEADINATCELIRAELRGRGVTV